MSGKPYNLGRPADESGAATSRRNSSRSQSRSSWAAGLVVLGACALGVAAPAEAGLTQLGPSKTAGEATPEQILSQTYGGTFVRNGDNFSNGSVTATRIDDAGGAEQRWNVNVTSARAVAAFSGYNQSFGQIVGGNYKPLFDVSGKGFDASGSASAIGPRPAGGFTFARAGDATALHDRVFSSRAADNRFGEDHLVSYRVSGNGPGQTYLLFWEDAIGRGSDFDHNDLVVELKADAGGQALLIPLPSAAWTGLSGLAALALLRGASRIRRRAA